MILARSAYNQKVTYWGSPIPDGIGGWIFNEPTVIKCRWEQKAIQFTDTTGETQVSRAVIYTQFEPDLGGYLYLGESVEENPEVLDSAYKIRQIMNIPNMRNSAREIRVFL